jgi:hypothetical protein
MILAIHFLGFLMEVQEGRKGQREAHSLVCSPRVLGEGQEDGNGSIERGKLGRLLPWRAHGGLDLYLLVRVFAWRRVHLWRRAYPYLEVGGLVLLQICLVHGGGGTQQVVCVQGILHWAKEEVGYITSVDRATRRKGTLS